MQKKTYSLPWAGEELQVEFNDLAEQANGSVIVRLGGTAVLATAVMGDKDREGIDYFPLTVDYEEKFYASGRIRGSQYVRREGRPSDESVVRGRIVDRTVRPLFESHIRREVQVVITTLAIDEFDPDILAVLAASISLGTSNIPWRGPVGALRVARRKGNKEWLVNPPFSKRTDGEMDFDLIACGRDGTINMMELEAGEISESEMVEALTLAEKHIAEVQKFQEKIVGEIGKEKEVFEKNTLGEDGIALFEEEIEPEFEKAIFAGPGKEELSVLFKKWRKIYEEKFPEGNSPLAESYFEEKVNDLIHKEAIEKKRRPDGRKPDELRSLFAQAGGISPALHGTGIFYRGGTHIFTALTLGGPRDTLSVEAAEGIEKKKRFMHHYNFPPYSTGEVGKMGGTNRRMIGHGALAEKSIRAVIPSKEIFPYTIRLVSEALSSNGSTSMGSVCGSSLALMDGGVPISGHVAGIAIGLMYESDKKYVVLTDIQGPEDHHGDMDLKVAGTKNGVTGVQLDVKVDGIPIKILGEALVQAKLARLKILEVLEKGIERPRGELSPRAPEIAVFKIKPDQIGLIIGSGGKTINEIRDLTDTEIDIEDDGTVFITGKNGSASKAKNIIEEMTREYRRGDRFEGLVTKILDFGAFVKIGHNTEGLVHISEIAPFRVERVTDVLHEGLLVPVAVKEVDERGRINLSIKIADSDFASRRLPAQAGGVKPKNTNNENSASKNTPPNTSPAA